MDTFTKGEASHALRKLGWRIRDDADYGHAVKNFQEGFSLGTLKADGLVGPRTSQSLKFALGRLERGQGTASLYFSFNEFACTCDGRFATCPRIWVKREFLVSLDKLRDEFYPKGLDIKSGCRCPNRNKEVGGVADSQHQFGVAADVPPMVLATTVRRAGLFAGIGYDLSSGKVAHVDRRDIGAKNTTKSSKARPSVWVYQR